MRMGLSRGVAVVGGGMIRFHHRVHEGKIGRELFVEARARARGAAPSTCHRDPYATSAVDGTWSGPS